MKFELKTENDNYSRSFSHVLKTVFTISLIIIFSDITLKLGFISKHYKIIDSCRLLSVEKSKSNFKNLSGISNLKSKQRILEFCREVLK